MYNRIALLHLNTHKHWVYCIVWFCMLLEPENLPINKTNNSLERTKMRNTGMCDFDDLEILTFKNVICF